MTERSNKSKETNKTDRRCFIARGIAGVAGVGAAAAGYTSIEEDTLQAAINDGTAEAKDNSTKKRKTSIAPGSLPSGKICDISFSRLMIGGNLIGGWAHSRDLMYTSNLFTAYNTEAKVVETLELAQDCGIDTIQLDPSCWPTITKYNKGRSKPIQTIVCCGLHADKVKMNDEVKRHVDLGATMIYSHGGATDELIKDGGNTDNIGQMVDLIKAQGVPAGIGSHSLNIPIACEEAKIDNDFYLKTFHTDKYWSATNKENREEYDWMRGNPYDHNRNHDAMWCNNPEETATFMEKVKKPWIAFKVMAAGAINPRTAFRYAFANGADFIVAGMFDFQVELDVQFAIEAIEKGTRNRKRPWLA